MNYLFVILQHSPADWIEHDPNEIPTIFGLFYDNLWLLIMLLLIPIIILYRVSKDRSGAFSKVIDIQMEAFREMYKVSITKYICFGFFVFILLCAVSETVGDNVVKGLHNISVWVFDQTERDQKIRELYGHWDRH